MAIDNLNYMVSWLPAWQQTDKYSWNPWCVKSKNLDIFSSSKSVKATAWDTQEQWATSYIDIDERGNDSFAVLLNSKVPYQNAINEMNNNKLLYKDKNKIQWANLTFI